jgi:hypothetical protein
MGGPPRASLGLCASFSWRVRPSGYPGMLVADRSDPFATASRIAVSGAASRARHQPRAASGGPIDSPSDARRGSGAPHDSGDRRVRVGDQHAHCALGVDPSSRGVPEIGTLGSAVPPSKLLPGGAPSLCFATIDPEISRKASDCGVAGLFDLVGQGRLPAFGWSGGLLDRQPRARGADRGSNKVCPD